MKSMTRGIIVHLLIGRALCFAPSRRFGGSGLKAAPSVDPSASSSSPGCYGSYYDCGESTRLFLSTSNKFEKVDEDDDQIISFVDSDRVGIDCYVDSYATVDGVEYTIGSPCDYAVALCYFDSNEQLVPIELEEELMDEIYPIAEEIIEDEFGEELVLQRTPQTLTLVGELEESEEEDGDEEVGEEGSEEDEEVEILVSFEENEQEYHLVRLLDPVLLVGKGGGEDTRILLTPQESDQVMPKIEKLFLSHQNDNALQ
ncbi:hypothetical protein THAOC_33661 [Thalassiosira oceanica]|uniref:Uncharacterized protein n=1 Tax=Thalassiosira oceanica TaxID=159749 RepID=K0RLM1_THAOC|nr:hypothetical protein THAOC_33661 [Thalassiosira oceanica]|eukprot:EJK47607.1 hypothetical protein THAOC_33661 [Thalassiosira oceanica]